MPALWLIIRCRFLAFFLSLVLSSVLLLADTSGRQVLLSRTGGDRATAYTMSPKMVRRGKTLICGWIESTRVNRWAAVDLVAAEIIAEGTFEGVHRDNHCGPAMALDPDGSLHIVTGGHHTSFGYYRLPAGEPADWPVNSSRVQTINVQGTYPGIVCDGSGSVHLAYRAPGNPMRLIYRRKARDNPWTDARQVMISASKNGYNYFTNALAIGPQGRIHIIAGNPQTQPDGSIYYGASHMYSDDDGDTWRQYGDSKPVDFTVAGVELKRIEGQDLSPARILSATEAAQNNSGPLSHDYLTISLSNLAIDAQGDPWVVFNNGLTGEAELYHGSEKGWFATPLLGEVQKNFPDFRIHQQSTLSRHVDGTLEAVLMVAPFSKPGWGPSETELLRILFTPTGEIQSSAPVRLPDASVAHWLPSLERWDWSAPFSKPALLYTRGINAGGFANNRNTLTAEVWLQLPPVK